MRIRRLVPATASDADVAGLHAVGSAALAVDRPGHPAPSVLDVGAELRVAPTGRRRLRYVAEVDGRVAGLVVVRLPDSDNVHLGLLDLVVHPAYRRRGVGTDLLRTALTVLAGDGRRILLGDTEEHGAGAGFCAAHGLRPVKTDQISRLALPELDWLDLETLAAADHPGYRLTGWADRCPDALLDAYARAKSAMNDAPTGDLDVTDRSWSTGFIRDWEDECRTRGREQRVVAAVHEPTGEIAGFTEVELWRWTPGRSEQADTAVVAEHRGHGLGLWMKATMLCQLRRARPEVTHLVTGNAADNSAMLRINRRIGYRPYTRLTEWQGDVARLRTRLN